VPVSTDAARVNAVQSVICDEIGRVELTGAVCRSVGHDRTPCLDAIAVGEGVIPTVK
jgi:hypothetical protein